MTDHTPLPWRVDPKRSMRVAAGDDDTIATTGCQNNLRDQWESNATFIVKAVNNYGAILKALQDILSANDDFRSNLPDGWEGDPLQDACDRAKAIMGEAK